MADNNDRDMSGALFTNDRKETDNHPDYTGRAVVNGVKVSVSAWSKVSAGGVEYFSLAFRPWVEKLPEKEAKLPEKEAPRATRPSKSLFD